MGKLVVTEFVTLDGVAQAPGEPDEDRDSGFTQGGWQAPLLDQESGSAMFEQAKSMDALLLGRKTYEIFADYWPRAPEEIPFTSLLNGVPKYVASRTLAGSLAWRGSTLLAGDLTESVIAMKERHGCEAQVWLSAAHEGGADHGGHADQRQRKEGAPGRLAPSSPFLSLSAAMPAPSR